MVESKPRAQANGEFVVGLEKHCSCLTLCNLTELEEFCKEEWCTIAVSRCATMTQTCPHRLSAVTASKGEFTK